MKRKFLMLFFLGMFLIFGITNVNASEITNFYSNSDKEIKLEKNVVGETALAGTIVDIVGNIDGIGFIAGKTVNQNGSLEYGFIAGDTVNIRGVVEKSLYIAGNKINITKDAMVGRDVYAVGEVININGKHERYLNIVGTNVTIKNGALLYGDVHIDAENITIEDNVKIYGTLNYNDDAEIEISDNGTIIPSIKKYTSTNDNEGVDTNLLLSVIVNLVIVFLVIVIVIPKAIDKTNNLFKKQNINLWFRNIGIGLLILICVPLVCILLLLSNIGVILGLVLTALFFIAMFLSVIFAGLVIGKLILVDGLKLRFNKYLYGIIGIIFVQLLIHLPIAGGFLAFLIIVLGLGIIWNLLVDDEASKKDIKNVKDAKVEVKKTENIKKEETKVIPVKEAKEEVKKTSAKKAPVKKEAKKTEKASTKPRAKKSTPKKTTSKETKK